MSRLGLVATCGLSQQIRSAEEQRCEAQQKKSARGRCRFRHELFLILAGGPISAASPDDTHVLDFVPAILPLIVSAVRAKLLHG
jgi:hypothetical protein